MITEAQLSNTLFLGNYTGSYMIPVMSDSDNSAMVTGFDIGFVLLPC